MNQDHIEKIYNYNKALSKINTDRKEKYKKYRDMMKTNNTKNILVQNEKKISQEKNKIINILLQDLIYLQYQIFMNYQSI